MATPRFCCREGRHADTSSRGAWPLLLGILLLMVGNGMQGTLLGIRGAIEGIPTNLMALVMAAYFGGFVLGSLTVPKLIQRVGHVRVFAALGSLISAVLVLYAAAPEWIVWVVMRFVIGFCVLRRLHHRRKLAERGRDERKPRPDDFHLHDRADAGLVSAQVLMNLSDPAGWLLFVIPSVLVSVSFTPILLASVPAPRFETIAPMSIGRLYRASPLGCVGHLPDGRGVRGAAGHGVGLGFGDAVQRRATSPPSSRRSGWAGCCFSIPSAGCRTAWTGAC